MICDRVREKGLCPNNCTVDSGPCQGFKDELAISAYSKRLFGKDILFTMYSERGMIRHENTYYW